MRFVERQKRLQAMSKRAYSASLSHARFITLSGTAETLPFAKGITVISGGNGAGKSTLLGSLWRCISGTDPAPGGLVPATPAWLREIEVVGTQQDGEWKAFFNPSDGGRFSDFGGSVSYIDPAAETLGILRQFRLDDHVSDLIEGLDPAPFSAKQLESLSFILRRDYSEFLVYEVTDFSEDDSPMPYFLATSMGKRYSIDQMGRGELNAAYLLWRLSSIPPGSIVLIEEPESHLATFSQDLLVDAVVGAAVEQDLCIVVSSHSPGFFQRLPSGNVALVTSLPVPSINHRLSSREIAKHLGVQVNIRAILLVEDRVAAEFLRALLEVVDKDTLRQVEIKAITTGESGVRRLISEMRSTAAKVPILGVLDGDQRGSVTDDAIGFLVGDRAPEDVLRRATLAWRSGAATGWSPALSGGEHEFRMALERFDGKDLHDWIDGLSAEFDGLRTIVPVLVDLLIQDPRMLTQAEELAKWIRAEGRLDE